MLKIAAALFVLSTAAPVTAQDSTRPPAGDASGATKISASALATDPRMLAAIRHANAAADAKCGVGVGEVVDLATKAAAQRCRRRMIETAKLDAEGEIDGH